MPVGIARQPLPGTSGTQARLTSAPLREVALSPGYLTATIVERRDLSDSYCTEVHSGTIQNQLQAPPLLSGLNGPWGVATNAGRTNESTKAGICGGSGRSSAARPNGPT
jgi:hypothetical protein